MAGTGVAGYSGDGGLATSARFNRTAGIAVDASGNIYVSDTYYHVIRKITKSTGIITTVAGTGRRSRRGRGYYTGDGGLATNATFDSPRSIAFDASGNIYVADTWNGVIRKITKSTGIITTVAGTGMIYYNLDGGLITEDSFSLPCDVALDSSGNIYYPEMYYNVIQKITKSTGIITTVTTVAGTLRRYNNETASYTGDGGLATKATLNGPRSIALDASGNIYVADTDNYVIRKITKSTGIITTVAGTGNSSNTGDGGLATSATIGLCFGIALDASGNIFITDFSFNVIRKITKSTGIITTVAGTGVHGSMYNGGPTSPNLNGPYYIAIFDQTAYFTDRDSHQVRSFSTLSTSTNQPTNDDSRDSRDSGYGGYGKSSAISNYMSVGLYNPVWWISASLLLLMW